MRGYPQRRPRTISGLCSYVSLEEAFKSGADTPAAFFERCVDAITHHEPSIKAFVHIDIHRARARANESSARWAAGRPLSLIDGMPIGVKDVIETANMPTELGSKLFAGWHSGRDSASVNALRAAGAIIVGKTVTTEFASSVPGPTHNPWDTQRTPGGSSSGSAAAVASGMLSAALGTQVVGSIIRPASYCGCIGFKPSVGAVNRGGSHDFMSQSSQGVLAASLADAWQVLFEIVSRAGGDPGYPGLAGSSKLPNAVKPRTITVLETSGWSKANPGAQTAFASALETLSSAGLSVVDRRSKPEIEAVERAVSEAMKITRAINAWESRWPMNIYRDRDASKLSKSILKRLHEAESMNIDDYRSALAIRSEARRSFARLADLSDLCVTLSASSGAPLGLDSTGNPAFAAPSSFLGVPALSLPLLSDEGLPLGLQLLGFEQRDADLFAQGRWIAGDAFQRAL